MIYRRFLITAFVAAVAFHSCENANGREERRPKTQHQDTTTRKKKSEPGDHFTGVVRAKAKTSYVDGAPEIFPSVKKLRNSLKDEEYMHKKSGARFRDADRCPEEQKNVAFTEVYIFAVSREDDNDFHVIIGSNKSQGKDQVLMSAEISALPDSTSPYYAKLKAVRDEFKAYFGERSNKEHVFVSSDKKPPIKLDYLEGSLFFDNHHYNAYSGFNGFKSSTAWEIHPVTAIKFAR
ncbi:MAG: hypothetical protein Fur0041_04610 [Bacteroidia bacterium]